MSWPESWTLKVGKHLMVGCVGLSIAMHALAFKSVCDESATVTPEMVDKWLHETLPHLLEQYDPSNV